MNKSSENEGLWPKMFNMNFEDEVATPDQDRPSEAAIQMWKRAPQKSNRLLFDANRTHSTDYAEEDLRHLKPEDLSDLYIADPEELPPQLPPSRKQEIRSVSGDSLWDWLQKDDADAEEETKNPDDQKNDTERLAAALGVLEAPPSLQSEGAAPGVDDNAQVEVSEEKRHPSKAPKSSTTSERESDLATKQSNFRPKGLSFLPSKKYALSVFDAMDKDQNHVLTFRHVLRFAKAVLPVQSFKHKAPIFEKEYDPGDDELLLWRHQIEGFLRCIIYYNCYYKDYDVREEQSMPLTRMEILQLFGAPVYYAVFGTQAIQGGTETMTYVQFCSRLAKNTCAWVVEVPEEARMQDEASLNTV